MTQEITLSPREQAILKLLSKLSSLSANFESKRRDALICESEGTELSSSILNICQAFARSFSFTDKDFFMLNYIAASLKRSPANCSIGSLLVNEPYIAETYKDMMSKRSVLDADYKVPCNIERLLSLGTDAVSYGTPRSYSPTDLSLFSGNDSVAKRLNCAFKGYFPAEDSTSVYLRQDMPKRSSIKMRACQTAIIYTRDTEKAETLENFFKLPASTYGVVDAFACHSEKLFERLLATNTAFTINADALPEVNILPNMPKEYRALIKASLAFFDRVVFGNTAVVITATAPRLGKICELANAEGLSICRAVSFKGAKNVTVTAQGKAVSTLGVTLLSSIRDMIVHSAQIPWHSPDKLNKETAIEAVYEDAKGENAVYRTTINISSSPAPYHDALYAAAGLILRAVADGFDLKDGNMRFSVCASLSLGDPKSIGKAVAAILGLYRVETEFCLAEENSAVEYSEEESTITLHLRAHSTQRRKKSNDYSSIDPILFSELDENGLPSFEDLRNFAFVKRVPHIIWRSEA